MIHLFAIHVSTRTSLFTSKKIPNLRNRFSHLPLLMTSCLRLKIYRLSYAVLNITSQAIWVKFWFCKISNFAKAVRHFSSDDRRIVNCRKIIVNSKWITVPMIESSHDYEPLFGFVLFLIFFCFLFCLFFVCLCIDEYYTGWLSGPFKIWKKLVDVTKQLFIGESNLRTFQGTEICRKYGTSKNKISDKN